jgi:hypothetical protein
MHNFLYSTIVSYHVPLHVSSVTALILRRTLYICSIWFSHALYAAMLYPLLVCATYGSMQYLVFSRSVCCHAAMLYPILVCATYGSMQYLVFSRSVCCHAAMLYPLLVCATYGSIQSVRKPDTAYIQCPPEDERCDARNM